MAGGAKTPQFAALERCSDTGKERFFMGACQMPGGGEPILDFSRLI
jgi:hypothetical protein